MRLLQPLAVRRNHHRFSWERQRVFQLGFLTMLFVLAPRKVCHLFGLTAAMLQTQSKFPMTNSWTCVSQFLVIVAEEAVEEVVVEAAVEVMMMEAVTYRVCGD